jgi:hypothetical protein
MGVRGNSVNTVEAILSLKERWASTSKDVATQLEAPGQQLSIQCHW